MIAFRALGAAFMQLYTHAVASFVSNAASLVLSLPIVGIALGVALLMRSFLLLPIAVAVLVCILPNPAAAGTQFLNHLLAHGDYLTLGDYRAGLREYFVFSLRCWIVSLAITVVLAGNAVFYTRLNTPFSGFLAVLWLFALFIWLSAQLYAYPLILQQEVRKVLVVYRNALLLVVARPIYTLFLTVAWMAVVLFTSATGLVTVVGIVAGAAIQQNAAARILPTFERVDAN